MMNIQTFTAKGNRKENQDRLAYRQMGEQSGIFVVADGMGGYSHGDVAAKVVADSIVESVSMHWSDDTPLGILTDAMAYANEALSLKRIALGGIKMGAVVCVLMLRDGKAYLCWLGDSRIYHYSNGVEIFHTRDHSMVQELLQINSLKASDLEKYSNIVTRSLMGNVDMDPLGFEVRAFSPGDCFLLCTDGLHKSVSMPIRLNEDFHSKLKDRGDNYSDNATCLTVFVD